MISGETSENVELAMPVKAPAQPGGQGNVPMGLDDLRSVRHSAQFRVLEMFLLERSELQIRCLDYCVAHSSFPRCAALATVRRVFRSGGGVRSKIATGDC